MNKEYLLKYLTNDLTPWEFESINSKKAINDSYRILGTKNKYAVKSCCAISTTDGNSKAIIAKEGKDLVDADSFRAQKLSQPLDLRLIKWQTNQSIIHIFSNSIRIQFLLNIFLFMIRTIN